MSIGDWVPVRESGHRQLHPLLGPSRRHCRNGWFSGTGQSAPGDAQSAVDEERRCRLRREVTEDQKKLVALLIRFQVEDGAVLIIAGKRNHAAGDGQRAGRPFATVRAGAPNRLSCECRAPPGRCAQACCRYVGKAVVRQSELRQFRTPRTCDGTLSPLLRRKR